ncbi:AtzE family amidohydrolase [Roseomonas sp. GC11]|uniref:AtzE family amidohydrolase n=1 Tax=Roseomonas sp. GC11 TaxID=2950546 RepID=UPI00210EB3E1|nr:AtzE family amidohydrolase [Roseomonas sp. GC11]
MSGAPLSATAIVAALRAGRLSARAVVEDSLGRIRAQDATINAFTDVVAERALARADALDAARARGEETGPLSGVPFAVKNLFDIAGLPTRAGSLINRGRAPAARDGFLVRRLEAAGAVLLGGLNMGEYAYDFTGENAHDGPSRNPRDIAHMAGGSSGGSGAAVAAGMVPLALGSDTNGSIRVPSSLCGLFGLKPTYGRLSREGSFPFVSSLDHLGPMAGSVADLALSYDAMQGPDAEDPMQAPRPIEPTLPELEKGLGGLRIAVAGGHFARGGEPVAQQAVALAAQALGASRVVDIPEAARARAAAYVITAAEGAALHAERLRARPQDFDPDVRDRLIGGLAIPAGWVARAQRFRRWYQARVMALFQEVELILAPATPARAPLLGQKTLVLEGQTVPLRPNLGIYTQPVSFIGLPVVAVPLWPDAGLPIGVQIIAPPWREDLALRAARALERDGVARCGVFQAG